MQSGFQPLLVVALAVASQLVDLTILTAVVKNNNLTILTAVAKIINCHLILPSVDQDQLLDIFGNILLAAKHDASTVISWILDGIGRDQKGSL